MNTQPVKIGIIIYDRYRCCAGWKYFRVMKNLNGVFSPYVDNELELIDYTACDGYPIGKIEYIVDER